MNTLKKISKIAGVGYLFIFVTGIFSNFFVMESLTVPGNAAATVNNISDNQSLYRIGILSFIIMVVWDVVLAWALYVLLKPVNENLSLLSGWLRLVNSAIFAIALFNLFNVLQIVSNADYLKVLSREHISTQVMQSFEAFNHTWLIGLVFFGLHLTPVIEVALSKNFLFTFDCTGLFNFHLWLYAQIYRDLAGHRLYRLSDRQFCEFFANQLRRL